MIGLKKIPYITLWVEKFDETAEFYRKTLGLRVKYIDKNFIQFKTTSTELYLHRIMDPDATPLRRHNVEIHFEVSDVDKIYESLKKKGVTFEQNPQNMPWGKRIVSFRDPEGYTIELVGPHKRGEPIVEH